MLVRYGCWLDRISELGFAVDEGSYIYLKSLPGLEDLRQAVGLLLQGLCPHVMEDFGLSREREQIPLSEVVCRDRDAGQFCIHGGDPFCCLRHISARVRIHCFPVDAFDDLLVQHLLESPWFNRVGCDQESSAKEQAKIEALGVSPALIAPDRSRHAAGCSGELSYIGDAPLPSRRLSASTVRSVLSFSAISTRW